MLCQINNPSNNKRQDIVDISNPFISNQQLKDNQFLNSQQTLLKTDLFSQLQYHGQNLQGLRIGFNHDQSNFLEEIESDNKQNMNVIYTKNEIKIIRTNQTGGQQYIQSNNKGFNEISYKSETQFKNQFEQYQKELNDRQHQKQKLIQQVKLEDDEINKIKKQKELERQDIIAKLKAKLDEEAQNNQLSSNLLIAEFQDNQLINKSNKKYLSPNLQVREQNQKIKNSYEKLIKWISDNEEKNQQEAKSHYGKDIGDILNSALSKMTNPHDDWSLEQKSVHNQAQAEKFMQIMIQLNQSSNIKKYASQVLASILFTQIFKSKQQNVKDNKSVIIQFYGEIIHKISYQMPQLQIKEIIIGRVMKAASILLPSYPKLQDYQQEIDLVSALGYQKDLSQRYREDPENTYSRIEQACKTIFTIMSDDAYIGKLFQSLKINQELINQRSIMLDQ
ncbi:UNKNOWN [Stylonychia lemnae]|uniref:Uncharacterized protein n=1 Tax=Stylonychia lemnae TaxID=5949 RepID=A0A078AUN9_STYLE|nr:UNKNOWN [Stylonychia lemnae]|eukprot:CDW85731.1 UNKNOWN [Stylonychia lemnae]